MDRADRVTTNWPVRRRDRLDPNALQQHQRLYQIAGRRAGDDEIAGETTRLYIGLEAVFHVADWHVILRHLRLYGLRGYDTSHGSPTTGEKNTGQY